MKIGEIEVGAEVGLVSEKPRYDSLPRQARVVEIVTVPETTWVSNGFTHQRGSRNVRKVRVELLGQPTEEYSRYRYTNAVHAEAGGTTLVVSAKQVIGPWSTLKEDVEKRVSIKDAEAERQAAVEARVSALLPKRLHDTWGYAKATGHYASKNKVELLTELRIHEGAAIDILLDLAEKGMKMKKGANK